MDENEVRKIADSVWKMTTEGRNRFGQHGAWLTTSDVDSLVAQPDVLALLVWLKARNCPNSKFLVADGLANLLGWSRRTFKAARRRLIQSKRIIPLNRPAPGVSVKYRWG